MSKKVQRAAPGTAKAKELLRFLDDRVSRYKRNTLYPAYGLNAMVEECEAIAEKVREVFGLPEPKP